MKSNEEFIAGIYEKATTYTEEKETKSIKVPSAVRMVRVAAMVVLCIGLLGVGTLTLRRNNAEEDSKEDQPGVAITALQAEEPGIGIAQFRIEPLKETAAFTGVVERIDTEANCIWIKADDAEKSVICVKWDILEPINEEIVIGTKLTATGILIKDGDTTKLVLTDLGNLEIKE